MFALEKGDEHASMRTSVPAKRGSFLWQRLTFLKGTPTVGLFATICLSVNSADYSLLEVVETWPIPPDSPHKQRVDKHRRLSVHMGSNPTGYSHSSATSSRPAVRTADD